MLNDQYVDQPGSLNAGSMACLPATVAVNAGRSPCWENMNRPTAVEMPRLSVPLALGWLCALSPFGVLFVVGTAWLHQQPGWLTTFGPFADGYRLVMLPVLNVAWSLSMMFAVYAAGPLWLLLVCGRRWRRSWKVHAMQLITCGAGWVLIWVLIIQSDLLSKLG